MFKYSMAGHLIAMLHVLRLKQPLQNTVTSPEFVRLKAFKDLAKVILDEDVWVWLFLQARAVYAMMRILRLADQKTAAMDKLYYYIKQADRVAPLYLAQAETYHKKLSDDVASIIKCTDDLASQTLDDEEDDDDDDNDMPMPELIPGAEDSDDDESVTDPDPNEEEDQKVSTIIFTFTNTMNLIYLTHEFSFCGKGGREA